MMKRIVFALAALSLSCALPATASETVYNNLSAASDGVISTASDPFGEFPVDTFSTGDSAFELGSISFLMNAGDPEDGGYFQFLVSIGLDDPIFISDRIQDSELSTSLNVITLPTGGISLAPDTRYDVEMGFFGSAGWSYSSDISGPGVAGEFWSDSTTDNVLVSNDDGHGPFQMAVETPEVSTWVMLLTGFVALGLAGASRRRRALV